MTYIATLAIFGLLSLFIVSIMFGTLLRARLMSSFEQYIELEEMYKQNKDYARYCLYVAARWNACLTNPIRGIPLMLRINAWKRKRNGLV